MQAFQNNQPSHKSVAPLVHCSLCKGGQKGLHVARRDIPGLHYSCYGAPEVFGIH